MLGIEPRDDGDARSQARTAQLARALTEGMRVRAEIPGTGYVLAPNSSKELLELKLLSDCIDEAPECMAAIGRDLGADVVLFGNIERRKDGDYAIWVRSLSVGTKKVAPLSLVKTISAADATDDTMRRLSAQVFPETAGKPLPESTEPAHPAGTKPAGAEPPLPPSGQEEAGEPPGKTSRVLFWTSLVVTGAGVAAFTITGLQVRSIEKEQDDALAGFNFAADGVQFPNDACKEASHDGYTKLVDICDRGKRMATVTNVLIGVTAAAAVATAIFYWRGYLAGGSAPERATARKSRPTRMVWAPELYQSGAGLGAVLQF